MSRKPRTREGLFENRTNKYSVEQPDNGCQSSTSSTKVSLTFVLPPSIDDFDYRRVTHAGLALAATLEEQLASGMIEEDLVALYREFWSDEGYDVALDERRDGGLHLTVATDQEPELVADGGPPTCPVCGARVRSTTVYGPHSERASPCGCDVPAGSVRRGVGR